MVQPLKEHSNYYSISVSVAFLCLQPQGTFIPVQVFQAELITSIWDSTDMSTKQQFLNESK